MKSIGKRTLISSDNDVILPMLPGWLYLFLITLKLSPNRIHFCTLQLFDVTILKPHELKTQICSLPTASPFYFMKIFFSHWSSPFFNNISDKCSTWIWKNSLKYLWVDAGNYGARLFSWWIQIPKHVSFLSFYYIPILNFSLPSFSNSISQLYIALISLQHFFFFIFSKGFPLTTM